MRAAEREPAEMLAFFLERKMAEQPENPCAKTIPMKQWIEETPQTDPSCRPCILGPVSHWYSTELRQAGHLDLIARLEDLASGEGLTPSQLAEELDKIKEEVPPEVRGRLREFDCSAQVNSD